MPKVLKLKFSRRWAQKRCVNEEKKTTTHSPSWMYKLDDLAVSFFIFHCFSFRWFDCHWRKSHIVEKNFDLAFLFITQMQVKLSFQRISTDTMWTISISVMEMMHLLIKCNAIYTSICSRVWAIEKKGRKRKKLNACIEFCFLFFYSHRCLLCAISRYRFTLISFAIFSRFKWKQICNTLAHFQNFRTTFFHASIDSLPLNPPSISSLTWILISSRGSETINSCGFFLRLLYIFLWFYFSFCLSSVINNLWVFIY